MSSPIKRNSETLPIVSQSANYGTNAPSNSGGAGAPLGGPGAPSGGPQVTISQEMLAQLMALAAKNSVPTQEETIMFPNGDNYEGAVRDGKPHGKGIMKYANNPHGHQKFEGIFRNGSPHQGIMKYTIQTELYDRYEGEFENDVPHGEGKINFKNGESWVGNVHYGQVTGTGVYQWPDGRRYEGMMANRKANGKGVLTKHGGIVYSGNFAGGHLHVQGEKKYLIASGMCIERGIFNQDQLWNGNYFPPGGYNEVYRNGKSVFCGSPSAYEAWEKRQMLDNQRRQQIGAAGVPYNDECQCRLI